MKWTQGETIIDFLQQQSQFLSSERELIGPLSLRDPRGRGGPQEDNGTVSRISEKRSKEFRDRFHIEKSKIQGLECIA